MKKIYLSASIRGGRIYQPTYAALVVMLERYGEVVNADLAAVDADVHDAPRPVREIYHRDMLRLFNVNAVVAEVSTPSLGVGYEISEARKLKLPVLCLYLRSAAQDLSAMIGGNPDLTVMTYGDLDEARRHIGQFFTDLGWATEDPRSEE